MNIALLSNLSSPFSGVGVYSLNILENLKHRGLKVKMVCTNADRSNVKTEADIQFLSSFNSAPVNHLLNFFVNPLRTPRGYDIYHVLTQSLGRFARFNHPVVVTVHDLSVLSDRNMNWSIYKGSAASNIFHIFAEKSVRDIECADAIICVSEFTRDEMRKRLSISSKRIKVVPNGVNHSIYRHRDKIEARNTLNLPSDKRIIINVGDEGPRKNINSLMKTFHKVKKSLGNIILIRIGEQRETTKNLIKRLDLNDNVIYYSSLPPEEIALFYNAADLLVYPSIYEGFGLPVLDAMASGCPVVATDRGAVPEVAGDAGIPVNPFDIERLSAEIEKALTDDFLKKELAERGIKRAAAYSWEKCAKETAEVYQKVLEKR